MLPLPVLLETGSNIFRDSIRQGDVFKKVYTELSNADSMYDRLRILLPPLALKSLGYVFVVMFSIYMLYYLLDTCSQSIHTRYDVHRAVKLKIYEELVFLATKAGPGQVRDDSMYYLTSMSCDSANTSKIIKCGGVPIVVRYAADLSDEAKRLVASKALLMMASEEIGQAEICRSGGLQVLRSHIASEDEDVRDHATSALWILSANEDLRPTMARNGVVGALLGVLQYTHDAHLKGKAAGALQNILSCTDSHEEAIAAGVVDVVLDTVAGSVGDDDLAAKSVGALANLALDDNNCAMILEGGGLSVLLWAVDNFSKSQEVRGQLVGALYNITSDAGAHSSSFLQERDRIVAFLELLEDEEDITLREMAKEITWNITRGIQRSELRLQDPTDEVKEEPISD